MTKKKAIQGKKNRASGADFERRVRKDLEKKGWIVDKWSNNVEFVKVGVLNEPDIKPTIIVGLKPAKHKFRGPGIPMAMGTGFPDFISLKPLSCKMAGFNNIYDVMAVECKTNGYLDKIEREKCRWLLDNNIFSKILIAEKTKEGRKIVIKYHDFEEKYGHND